MEGIFCCHGKETLRGFKDVPSPVDLFGERGNETSHWYGIGQPPRDVRQGWKLYLSATPANFTSLVRAMAPICVRHGISFKYLRTIEKLQRANAGLLGYSQIGKNFVIYLHCVAEASGALGELKSWLDHKRHYGPAIPRLRRLWTGTCAFVRYGAYFGESLYYDGREIPDDRTDPEAASRLFTFDIAPSLSLTEGSLPQQEKPISLLAKYPVRHPICRSGKGGVFQALDVASGLDVIAKVGLRHGAELPDGRDGAFFVGNEAVMYQRMRERGLGTRLPGFIAFACEDDASILILEKLNGDNLWTGRKNLSSDPEWIRQAIDAMQAVHRTGFVLGDAKLTNFVVSGSSLRIIDLESCQDLKADRVELMPASFRIVGIAGLDHFEVDLMHFLASVLFVEEQHGSLLADRTIDLAEVMNRAAPRDPWDELAMETIRRMMERHGSLSAVARCDLTCPDELNQ